MRESESWTHAGAAAGAYGLVSILMTLFNKAVLSVYGFRYPLSLLTVQLLVSMAVLAAAHALALVHIPRLPWATVRAFVPLALLYNSNVVLALVGLSGSSVPVYSVLKRLTPGAVMLLEAAVLGKATATPRVRAAVGLCLVGAVVAGYGDLDRSLWAYAASLTSVLLQSLYLLLVQRTGATRGLSALTIAFYMAVVSVPCTAAIALYAEDVWAAPQLHDAEFCLVFAATLLLGVALTATLFWNTVVNSALATTVVGVLKGVLSTVAGMIVFSYAHTASTYVGVALSTVGGVSYAVFRYQEKVDREKAARDEGLPLPIIHKR